MARRDDRPEYEITIRLLIRAATQDEARAQGQRVIERIGVWSPGGRGYLAGYLVAVTPTFKGYLEGVRPSKPNAEEN